MQSAWCTGKAAAAAAAAAHATRLQHRPCYHQVPHYPPVWLLQTRAALLTAAQCATYDELKLFFVRGLGWEDNLQTHLSGELAGWGISFFCGCFVTGSGKLAWGGW